jgi:hypothetical protein
VAVAWTTYGGARDVIQYVELADDGSISCGPVTILDPRSTGSISAGDNDYTLAVSQLTYGQTAAGVGLYRIPAGCGTPSSAVEIHELEAFSPPSIAQGSAGYAVALGLWPPNHQVELRLTGPNFCD